VKNVIEGHCDPSLRLTELKNIKIHPVVPGPGQSSCCKDFNPNESLQTEQDFLVLQNSMKHADQQNVKDMYNKMRSMWPWP